MWPGYHKRAQSGTEMVVEPSPCEWGGFQQRQRCWIPMASTRPHTGKRRRLPEMQWSRTLWQWSSISWVCQKLPRDIQVVLHGTSKPSLFSWHVAAPDVALRETKPQRSSEPPIFKRFGAWFSACGRKWKCIHEEQIVKVPSCCCLSAVSGYI